MVKQQSFFKYSERYINKMILVRQAEEMIILSVAVMWCEIYEAYVVLCLTILLKLKYRQHNRHLNILDFFRERKIFKELSCHTEIAYFKFVHHFYKEENSWNSIQKRSRRFIYLQHLTFKINRNMVAVCATIEEAQKVIFFTS